MQDMLVRLYDLPRVDECLADLAERNVLIRRAMAYEKLAAVTWVQAYFGGGWPSECEVPFSRQPISCFLATSGGRILGFACYDSVCKDFLGPIGVLESARRRGIGKGLLLA
jgi:hypothetical protein